MPDWWIGRKHSEETKAKMSAARLGDGNAFFGRKHSPETRDINRQAHVGKVTRRGPHTSATRNKISASRLALGSAKGDRNPNWKGGVSRGRKAAMSTAAYRAWRLAVFTRDDYTCQLCGHRGGNLEADHIKPWAYFTELRLEVTNGRTLCLGCHRGTFKEIRKWETRARVG